MNKQKGSFAVELGLVLFTMCAILMFATDVSKQLLIRGSLDRTSFALVNVLKERTRYFDGNIASELNLTVNNTQLKDMQKVASRLLEVPSGDVAISISSLVNDVVQTLSNPKFNALGCTSSNLANHKDLIARDSDTGTVYPLYSVTVCQKHDSWYASFIGENNNAVTLTSSSIIVGR